ncbi:MAG TPA: hypothetical protein VNO30_42050 [Kofleriaceae bacterium]|nr:hypothetical protein [Kofleriaceae bacterium]
MFDPGTDEARLDGWAERLAQDLTGKISQGRLWLQGGTGTGRHSIVQRLSRKHGVLSIEIPPLSDLDAALHALVQGALHGGCLPEIIAHPRQPMLEQASVVGCKLAERGCLLAVILPISWSDRREIENIRVSRERVAEILKGLATNESLRILVVTGDDKIPPEGFEQAPVHKLEVPRVRAEQIQSKVLEGRFRRAAEHVAGWMAKNQITYTPLETRLHVGIVALGGRPAHAALEGLASRLAGALESRPALAHAVQRLLIARRPLPLDEVRKLSGVDEEYLPLLTSCIGYGREQVRVPERTRQILMTHFRRAANPAPPDEQATHAELARYYENLDGEVAPSHLNADRAIAWLEKVHHLAWGGEATRQSWEAQRHLGREQIWERARHLSLVRRRYDEAARLYRRCIEDFGEDSYSLHYEAFNLERAHGPKRLVRDGYAAAVAMDKDNPWWNARWTTFLIANGTLAEAEHAWREALRYVDPTGDRMAASPWLALHLHQWVCRQWLALGYVQEARSVLDEIYPRWLDSEHDLSALRSLVEDHEEGLRLGESVYPAEVPQHERWQKPRVLDARNADKHELRRWWPGRVLDAHPTEVVAVIADTQTRLAQQVTFTDREWRDAANQPAEDAEGFFELGEYAGGARIVRRTQALASSLLDVEYERLVNDLRS